MSEHTVKLHVTIDGRLAAGREAKALGKNVRCAWEGNVSWCVSQSLLMN